MSFSMPAMKMKSLYLNYYIVVTYLYGKKLVLDGIWVVASAILNQGSTITSFHTLGGKYPRQKHMN
jgi:hypothetical protein